MDRKLELLMQLTKVSSIVSRRISGHGLAFSDFMILYFIDSADDGKLRRIDLADLMGLTASGVTRMILPMEKLGIIERSDDTNDARARYAKLTRAGKELLKDATTTLGFKAEDLLSKIDNSEIEKIIKIFNSINNG